MGEEEKVILSLEGVPKLLEIIKHKERDVRRFKEGFLLTIDRNLKNGVITSDDAEMLKSKMLNMKL